MEHRIPPCASPSLQHRSLKECSGRIGRAQDREATRRHPSPRLTWPGRMIAHARRRVQQPRSAWLGAEKLFKLRFDRPSKDDRRSAYETAGVGVNRTLRIVTGDSQSALLNLAASSDPLVASSALYECAPAPASLPPSTIRYSFRIGRFSNQHSRISRVPAA